MLEHDGTCNRYKMVQVRIPLLTYTCAQMQCHMINSSGLSSFVNIQRRAGFSFNGVMPCQFLHLVPRTPRWQHFGSVRGI